MINRRDFARAAVATAILTGSPSLGRAAAGQAITQDDLLRFEPLGQVTLVHFTDLHAQLVPLYFREPAVNIGVGTDAGLPPHLTGRAFLDAFGIPAGSREAYALDALSFSSLAREYGRMGGFDRIATVVNAIRAQRPTQTLVLDGGDTWQGSYTSLKERGADMVRAQNALGIDAMTAHWEFTYGEQRVKELRSQLSFPFLAGNVKDATWGDRIFDGTKMFERGGIQIAVIGQAFPYTPIANPRWMVPDWSFGIEEDRVREEVAAARKAGADLVVLLSHNGFDVDRKLAARVEGIDVILTGHTHDAIPRTVLVGNTILTAPGSHGKFVGRLDLQVANKRVAAHRFRLIPIFSDAIAPDPKMAALIAQIRAPYQAELGRVLARTESLLYRRGNFNGTFDDVICDALLQQRDAQIALSPGFRWGASLVPGDDIRVEDVYNQTAITYPAAYRTTMSGATLKSAFEDVADNLFNPDPYYQQGGDMVRVGGMSYAIDVAKPIGSRISEMRLANGEPIEPAKNYVVAGWASVNAGTEGPPVYDVVAAYLRGHAVVNVADRRNVTVRGADPRGIAS